MKKPKRERYYVGWVRLAYRMTETTLPKYRHRNSPKTYTQPQLVAAVMLGFYLDLGYRDLEEWLLASEAIWDSSTVPTTAPCAVPMEV